jgi:hypothetical protein
MHSFSFFQRITRTSLVPSSTLICTYLVYTRKFLTAPTNLTMWSGWPSFKMNLLHFQTAEWIIFAVTGISICSPYVNTPGFLLLMKGSSSTNRSPSPSFYSWHGVTNNAAKPDCILPTGDDGSSYECCLSGELIVIKINETLLSRKQQLCQKCEHRQSHFNFPNTDSKKISTRVSLLKRNDLLAKLCFLLNLSFVCLPKLNFSCVCAFLSKILILEFFF